MTKPLNRTPSATSLSTTASFQKHTVDHRPTRLLVSGYETDEQDSVLSHFQVTHPVALSGTKKFYSIDLLQQYGEIVDYVVDSSLPSITLNYKTRKEAEMALLKGKNFQVSSSECLVWGVIYWMFGDFVSGSDVVDNVEQQQAVEQAEERGILREDRSYVGD